MATLCHFPSFPSLPARKLFSSNRHNRQELKLGWQQNAPHKRFRFRASSIKKSRKVKTNAELCDNIREFVAAVGLPEGRLPTMKEFSLHGRSDLAYSVRRRGYKRIGEILGSTKETDLDGSNVEKVVSEDNYALGDSEDKCATIKKGQDEEPNIVVGDFPSSTGVSVVGDISHSLVMDSEVKLDDDNHVLVEASADLPLRETASYELEGHNENGFIVGENSFSETEDSITEYDSCRSEDPTFDSGNHSQRPLETSTNASLGENGGDEMVNIAIESAEDLLAEGETGGNGLNGGNEMVNVALESVDGLLIEGETGEKGLKSGDEIVDIAIESADDFLVGGETSQNFQFEDNNVANEDTSSAEVFVIENDYKSSNIDSALSSNDDSSVPIELSSLSLEERVANFMQYGHLDTVEEDQFVTSEHSEKVPNGGNGAITSNESAEKSFQVVPSTTGNSSFRDNDLSAERQSAQFSKKLDVKTSKRENRVEISHLKFMLHQKELELSRLKEQIEKEKHDLSGLQAKAQSEISKAQQLISEKDAELHAAEETLSGLVEVYIQYHGDGDIVEVAGSFNGWHHWIKMDPQPSSSIIDSVGPRKSKIWSTVLWLYPGVYEIKFIVDGEWKIDPQRESVTRGYICNNILRVEGE